MHMLRIVKIISAAFVFGGFLIVCWQFVDPDMGWHLKVGEDITLTRSVPHYDTFSWTMPGHEWVDHEWLVNALLWEADRRGWWPGAVVFFSVAASFPFWYWLRRARNVAGVWLAVLAAFSMHSYVGVRPQMLSFALFFIAWELIRREKYVYLPPLFFVWANVHAGFASGLFLWAVWLFANCIETLRTHGFQKTAAHYALPFFWFSASVGLTFANPYGAALYREIWLAQTSHFVSSYVLEWLPIASRFDVGTILFLSLAVVLTVRFRARFSYRELAVSAIFLALAAKTIRHWPLFVVVALPLVSDGFAHMRREILEVHARFPFSRKSEMILRAGAVLACVLLVAFWGVRVWNYHPMVFPEGAAAFLQTKLTENERRVVRLFNNYGWGGYLIWHVPDVKVFIDGRMPYWQNKDGSSAMKDYIAAHMGEAEERRDIFSRRGVNMALVLNVNPNETYGFWSRHLSADTKRSLRENVFMKVINDILVSGEQPVFLKDELVKDGWSILYEDPLAAVLSR